MPFRHQRRNQVLILGRRVRWTEKGYEYEADPRHRKMVLDHFGFGEGTRALANNGGQEGKEEEWASLDSDQEGFGARLTGWSRRVGP